MVTVRCGRKWKYNIIIQFKAGWCREHLLLSYHVAIYNDNDHESTMILTVYIHPGGIS